MKGTKVLTLGTVGTSFHGFTGHIDYTCVSLRTCADTHLCLLLAHALAHAHYFPHTKWLTVVSCTEAVDADLLNGAFSEKILRLN